VDLTTITPAAEREDADVTVAPGGWCCCTCTCCMTHGHLGAALSLTEDAEEL